MQIWTLLITVITLQNNIYSTKDDGSIGDHNNEMTHNLYCKWKSKYVCIRDPSIKFKT